MAAPWETRDWDVPMSELDVWDDDNDAYLASVQNLRRGGRGIWYDENDDGELDALGLLDADGDLLADGL